MGYGLLKWVTPNQLTMARIITAPVLMGLVYLDRPLTNVIAAALFTLAGLTDYVDGNLARFRGEVTQLGRMLDPTADKVMVSASLVMLVSTGHVGAVPVIIIIVREFAVSGLRQVASLEGVEIHVSKAARWKTTIQMTATGLLLLNHDPFGLPLEFIGTWLLWVAVAFTMWTGYEYFAAFFRQQGGEVDSGGEPTPPAPAASQSGSGVKKPRRAGKKSKEE